MNFKNEKDKMFFTLLHPALIMIYCDMLMYAKEKHNIDLVVTETITSREQDKRLGRVSDAHQKAIAIDIRTKDIDKLIVADIVDYINIKWIYKKYHYLSGSGSNMLAFYHTGNEEHIHLQIHQKYAKNKQLLASLF